MLYYHQLLTGGSNPKEKKKKTTFDMSKEIKVENQQKRFSFPPISMSCQTALDEMKSQMKWTEGHVKQNEDKNTLVFSKWIVHQVSSDYFSI